MKTFKVTYSDIELVHYTNTAIVEAESEKQAIELALKGEGTKETETFDYSDFNLETAKEYANGKPFITEIECEELPTPEQVDKAKIEAEIQALEYEVSLLKSKLKS
jgi:hypothetical protein